MSGPYGPAKTAGKNYTAEEKRAAAGREPMLELRDAEREIIKSKRSIKHNKKRLDVLRAVARDFRKET
jgi:hypothetical protein